MKNKIDFKILFRRLRHLLKNIGSDADKDWKIMISVFFITFVGLIIFHTNLFLNIKNRLGDSARESESNNSSVNTKLLDEMVLKYDKRAEEYKKIENTQFQLIDPS